MNFHKFPPTRFIFGILNPSSVKAHGYTLYVDRYDFTITPELARGVYEQEETRKFIAEISPEDVIVDVGANVGYFTLLFSKYAKKVYAFEPAPTQVALLQKTIAKNNIKNIEFHPYALSDGDGTDTLYLNDYNHGDNRMYETVGNRNMIPQEILTKTLDSVVKEKVDLIKIDIQGSEPKMLRGADHILRTYKPKLMIEYWPKGLERAGSSGEELITLIKSYGYKIPEDFNPTLYTTENGAFTNLFCVAK